ncbi:hypothetical protein [Vibrio tapetis]|uniref:Uncharacterized protein n=1 Tax=Vibrio tapetis subsp. tapetis TaxID=1671868 RepID=A0A2N8ZLH5_9VIBR|nr:hypothetical protein [Vibrio tapetis]SON52761.1 exported protein of unknown function [Vibrio tapetis subsp. tapetis]
MKIQLKQRGAASIWFVLIFSAIAAFAALGIEGTRYLNYKARLGDALETSAMLLSADQAEQELKLDGVKKEQRKQASEELVHKTIKSYLKDTRDIPNTKIDIRKRENNQGFDYHVAAVTSHDSVMHMSGAPSFDEQQDVYNFAAATKNSAGGGGGGVGDVILVLDHSMSMNADTCTHFFTDSIIKHQTAKLSVAHKFTQLMIEQVRKPLRVGESHQQGEEAGRLAVIPFDNGTHNLTQSEANYRAVRVCENHLVFDRYYSAINWHEEAKNNNGKSLQQIIDGNSSFSQMVKRSSYTEKTNNGTLSNWMPFNREHVDVHATVAEVTKFNRHRDKKADLPINAYNLVNSPNNRICRGSFKSIGLDNKTFNGPVLGYGPGNGLRDVFTQEIRKFTSGAAFQPDMKKQSSQYWGGFSNSSQGVIAGLAEIAKHEGDKPLSMFVLVGGKDSANSSFDAKRNGAMRGHSFSQDELTSDLLEAGLFKKTRERYPHVRFILVKLSAPRLGYESHFDKVIELNHRAIDDTVDIGRCRPDRFVGDDYKFDRVELDNMSKQIGEALKDSEQAFSGNTEVGTLNSRRR